MKDFYIKHKKTILIALSVCLAVALAVVMAFALADTAKIVFSDEGYMSHINGSLNSDALSSQNSSLTEPTDTGIPLVITSPEKNDVTVAEPFYSITGTSDPTLPLLLNGNEVERLPDGNFTIEVELKPGSNNFTFLYGGQNVTYNIRYTFTVIKAYAPYEKQSYEAGSSFVAVAYARVDSSSVTATFNGKTINLTPQPYKEGEQFTNFTGSFTLPTGNEGDINLGGVKFTGSCQGLTRSYTSPSIICLRDKALDGTQIVEIVASQAETFNGNTTDDWSRPTNSYLPAGTVDYKVGGIVYEAESGNSYYNLRCGKRVYIDKKNAPDTTRVTVSKLYAGELPEYNTISLAESKIDGKHSVLTFDTAWRAPFAVEIGPQSYTNPSKQDYTISSVTYSYIDIKFFYTREIGGDFAIKNHPLFSSAQIISGSDGYTLRLHLKSVGAFYGWNAEYNSNGQLEFKFLNAPKVTKKNDLSGIKIVIDAGHGGRDIGAPGLRPDTNPEAERNLSLAFKLKAQLEAYGATVVMSRTTNVELSSDARCEFLRQQAPDLCISVHHDSSTRASANGAGFFCFNAFSDKAVKYVYDRTVAGKFYSKTQKSWHYFYLARVTSCPVILTENGFISNQQDFNGIISDSVNTQKAQAITLGVLDYFNSFYKNVANDDDNSYNDDNSENDQTSSEQPPVDEPNQPPVVDPEQPPEQDQESKPDEDPKQEENNNTGDENENE